MRLLLVLIASLATLAAGQQETQTAQTSQPTAPKQQTCTFQGRVMNMADGKPVRKAAVRLSSAENNGLDAQALSAATDAEGKFAFNELAAGRYSIVVSHPSFVSYPYRRASRARLTSTTYTLAPGQEIKDVVIQMTPGAVLRGTVTDEECDPVVQAQVTVLRAEQAPVSGRAAAQLNIGNGSTDDHGEFRIFSLPPGRYYVKANPAMDVAMLNARPPKAEQRAYIPTFYPAAASRETAVALELRGGEEVPLNIALQRGTVYSVTGTLLNGKGAPVSQGMVMVMAWRSQGIVSNGQAQVKDGKFELHVPAGRYTLMGVGLEESFSPGQMPANAHKAIVVGEGELRGVELVLGASTGSPAQVSGRVRVDKGTLPAGQHLMVVLQPMHPQNADEADEYEDDIFNVMGHGGFAQTKDDGAFEMKDVAPGTYELIISSMRRGVEDWYTKAVVVGTRDALNSGITIAGSALHLDVVVSPSGGSVEGVVQDNDHHPVASSFVVLVPDAARAKRRSLFQTATTDQNGHFLVRGLEPGEYTAYAWDDIEDDAWFGPDIMKRYKDDGVSVTVRPSEKAAVQMRQIANLKEEGAK